MSLFNSSLSHHQIHILHHLHNVQHVASPDAQFGLTVVEKPVTFATLSSLLPFIPEASQTSTGFSQGSGFHLLTILIH